MIKIYNIYMSRGDNNSVHIQKYINGDIYELFVKYEEPNNEGLLTLQYKSYERFHTLIELDFAFENKLTELGKNGYE